MNTTTVWIIPLSWDGSMNKPIPVEGIIDREVFISTITQDLFFKNDHSLNIAYFLSEKEACDAVVIFLNEKINDLKIQMEHLEIVKKDFILEEKL